MHVQCIFMVPISVCVWFIQNWVIQGAQPNLVLRDSPVQLERVPSVFVGSVQEKSSTGLVKSEPVSTVAMPTGDEGEGLMEIDELETSICDNLLVRDTQMH